MLPVIGDRLVDGIQTLNFSRETPLSLDGACFLDVVGLLHDHYIAFALNDGAQYMVVSGLTSPEAERILDGLS